MSQPGGLQAAMVIFYTQILDFEKIILVNFAVNPAMLSSSKLQNVK